ncbi:LOS4 [Artemisia annua]|uniref:LOS4 n=1 Tax=Artemisia annua TaxID=35608 RepID=A0A2U1NC66_ARTAN|nr:LOS4 [Artemisia annua]
MYAKCGMFRVAIKVFDEMPERDVGCWNTNMEVLLKMGKFTGITLELGLPPNDKANYRPIAKRAPVTAQLIIGAPGTINSWITAKKLGGGPITQNPEVAQDVAGEGLFM